MKKDRRVIVINGRKKNALPENRKETDMFDMNNVGRKIAELRKANNMTQMELADKMNISFQAVSNWERGVSMPDISKLPELAELFGVSIDVLLGEKSEIIENAAADTIEEYVEHNEVSAEELSKAAPMLKPKQVDTLVEGVKAVSLKEAIGLMPFVSSKMVDKLVLAAAEKGDFDGISSAAPFASSDALGKAAEMMTEKGMSITKIAPFLSGAYIDSVARKRVEMGQSIDDIAVFVSRKTMDELIMELTRQGKSISKLAVFASRRTLDKVAVMRAERGESINNIGPFLSSRTIEKIITGRMDGSIPMEDTDTESPEDEEDAEKAGKSSKEHQHSGWLGGMDISGLVHNCMRMAKNAARWGQADNVHIHVSRNEECNDDEDGDIDEDELAEQAREMLLRGESIADIADMLDEDDIDDIARKAAETGVPIDCDTAEHMSEDAVDDAAMEMLKHGHDISHLLDYMTEDGIDSIAVMCYERGGAQSLFQWAQYASEETMGELAEKIFEKDGIEPLVPIAQYIDGEALARIAAKSIMRDGIGSIAPISEYIDEEELGSCIKEMF